MLCNEELLAIQIQKVFDLVDLPLWKKAIGTIGFTETRRMREELWLEIRQDPKYPKKVYKVVKALYGLHQAPRAWYLKGKPKLGLWYPRVFLFDLEAYLDSDYAGANLDRKSTTGGCQFLGMRLIYWQCKKAAIVATSTTRRQICCCCKLLWASSMDQIKCYTMVQFHDTKIYIDNGSTICIVKNPVYHSKTKHIAIRHHFIRDAHEKKLIQVLKIHTDNNVADLLTKAFDVSMSFNEVIDFLAAKLHSNATHYKQLANVPIPLDHFPINTLTSKVFSFMVKKGKHFSRNVTPLFASMLVQPTKDEGAPSERPSEAQPTPSPTHTSEVPFEQHTDSSPAHTSEVPIEHQNDPSPRPSPFTIIPDSIPETSGGNLGGHSSSDKSLSGNEGELTIQSVNDLCLSLCVQLSDQAKEIQHLKARIKKLKKQAKPVIKHHRAWMQIQGNPLFDEIPEDTVDHMETENAQDVGRIREIMNEDKEIDENILSTKDVLSTDKEKVSTDRQIVSTDGSKVSTDKQIKGTEEQIEGTEEQIKSTDGQRKELKDIEETDRPRPTSTRSLLTLRPLPKIDPKDKGKKKIEEEDETDKERNRIAEEKATNEALIRNFDDIKARIEADRLLAERLQEQEREQFTIEERAKFLHDTIAAQRKFLAQQRSEAIRNRPPTKNQLRNQMMTYLKHVGNFKHAELKIKKFEEVQALYEKIKRSDEDFISIGSAEDERLIKRMNEKGIDSSKDQMVKEESKEEVQEESKEEESKRKRKLGTRKKMKSRKRRFIQNTSEDDSEKENDELRLHLIIAPDEEKEVDYEILDRKYPIKEWKTECLGIKPQDDKAEHLEEINQNVVIRSNGQKRYFSTLMRVLSIFDREDLNAVYQLVMDRYQDEIPEGFDRVLWGDLMVMFNPDDENEFWNSQQDWNIVSWKLHGSSGVHTLVTEAGLVIHMLIEKKYPLRKEVLMQMLKLKLESEEDSTMALELIRFVKKLLAELEPEE
ncbi:hypothetical protein Tco_1293094 [Tanacetum coccineum]